MNFTVNLHLPQFDQVVSSIDGLNVKTLSNQIYSFLVKTVIVSHHVMVKKNHLRFIFRREGLLTYQKHSIQRHG